MCVNIREKNCTIRCFLSLPGVEILWKSLFLHVFFAVVKREKPFATPCHAEVLFNLSFSSLSPSTDACRNVNGGDFGFLWISIDHSEMMLISTYHLMMFSHLKTLSIFLSYRLRRRISYERWLLLFLCGGECEGWETQERLSQVLFKTSSPKHSTRHEE